MGERMNEDRTVEGPGEEEIFKKMAVAREPMSRSNITMVPVFHVAHA